MKPLPAEDLRSNVGTWAVAPALLPAVGAFLHAAAPNEPYDPYFLGQDLRTSYFDTVDFRLRQSRRQQQRYLTLRLRCYRTADGQESYALSAKTEQEKWRAPVTAASADTLLAPRAPVAEVLGQALPGHLFARLLEISGDKPVLAVVAVSCRRYAVENDAERWTLDVDVATDTGLCLPAAVLEHKSTAAGGDPGPVFQRLGLRPLKLSKFLWATTFAPRS